MSFALVVRIVYVNLWALFKLMLDLSVMGFIATFIFATMVYTFIATMEKIFY